MNWSQNRLAFLVAVLLLVASALYTVGTAIEHSQRAEHHAEQPHAASSPAKSGESSAEKKAKGETSTSSATSSESSGEKTVETTTAESTTTETTTAETATESTAPTPAPVESGSETHSEKIAGVDPESWPLVGAAIAVSLLVAAGVYWRRGGWLIAAIVLGIVFAAADTRELVHQLQESRTTVATIAGILIALHLLVALGAAAARRVSAVAGP